MITVKKSKLISLSAAAMLFAVPLSGCSSSASDRSQEVAEDQSIQKYDLVWFDYVNDSESDKAPLLKASYVKNGKEKTETFKKYVENVEQPYIKIRDHEAFIYRPPYIKYDQEPLEGVVKDKVEQKSSDEQ
ncbi:hypothetical protein MOB49_18320 [Bacillus haynesii]|uniref:hypothetical protein n=1 Tax=Bacillus haynesii TaxID=1925021 RepID=UPI002280D8D8|nr:hypothetical protein [Bacillus haynesii]MCY7838510.1 hypothetical protein [Bacillus haynesii]MCY7968999.1 hypothetical protein [Bacillus haynesii]MCY8393177.1 hypothetical protein [Bacillus haynesii]MCY8549956.1 hypothetical protein [Bacillus haynesii]MCY9210877.1 hypothetical protein [Bacillus haynesii]